MAITRQKKEEVVKDLVERLPKTSVFLFADNKGIPVKDLSSFRRQLKKENIDFKVIKKTLLKKALEEAKIPMDAKNLEGQIAIVMGYQDEVSVPKFIYKFSKENNNLKIIKGFLGGKELSKEEVMSLAKLPTREELLGRLVYLVSSPITNFASVLQANTRNLVFALNQIQQHKS